MPGQQYPGYYAAPPPNESSAVTALVLSIVGIVIGCFPLGIVGVVMGNKSKKRIAESGGTLGGEGLATGAIIVGWIGIGLTLLLALAFGAIFAASAGSTY